MWLALAAWSAAHAAPLVTGQAGYGANGAGMGFGLFVGDKVSVPLVHLVPELGFTEWTGSGTFVPAIGARVSVLKLLEPGAYGHLLVPIADGVVGGGWDGGLSLDLALPVVRVGLDLGALELGEGPTAVAGLHVGLTL